MQHFSMPGPLNQSSSSSTSAAASPSPQPIPHLRQACDGCSVAKVKCDKTHPSCGRCVNNKQPCKYSDSRRNGKRSRQPPPIQRPSTATTGPIPEVRRQAMPHFIQPSWEIPDNIAQHITTALPPLGNPLDPVEDWMSTAFDVNFDFDDTHRTNPNLCMTPTSLSNTSQSPMNVNLPRGAVPAWNKASISAGNAVLGPYEPRPNEGHDCEASAMDLLHFLRFTPERPGSASLAEHFNNSASGLGMVNKATKAHPAIRPKPTIDMLLLANKLALKKLTDVLQCACAQSPHISLLLSAIISKVLYWYRIVATSRENSDYVRVSSMKIQFGMLEMDDEDQVNFQRVVLQRELRKMEKVLEQFAKVSRCSLSDDDGEGATRSSQWQSTVVGKLREEMENDMHEAKRGQGER